MPEKPSPSWAWKSSDPGPAWVVEIGGYIRPITNEISRITAGGLFFFDTKAHAEDARNYFGWRAFVFGVTTTDVAGITALLPGSNPANPPLGGINDVGDFFHRLTEKNTWVRVGEVISGLLIVWAGSKALLRDTPVSGAADSAKSTAGTIKKAGRKLLK